MLPLEPPTPASRGVTTPIRGRTARTCAQRNQDHLANLSPEDLADWIALNVKLHAIRGKFAFYITVAGATCFSRRRSNARRGAH